MTPAHLDIPERAAVIAAHKKDGGLVAAVLPIHYSRALLRAHGYLPVELWGPAGADTSAGDTHLQAYTCSVIRSGLAHVLSGRADVADLLFVPHTCDSLQGLASLLIDFLPPRQPVLPLYLPRGGHNETTRGFLAAELRACSDKLAEHSGTDPDSADLHAAIAREEVADAALAELLDKRGSLSLSDKQLYRLARSREYLPAERFAPLVRDALDRHAGKAPTGVPILLSGMFPEPAEILDALADAGAVVVADDLACCGRRRYPTTTGEDPFARMAERILSTVADSILGVSVEARCAHLVELARKAEARAVVFFEVKFCEPEQFYLPQIRQALDKAGLSSVVIEVDISEPLPHQAITRLEALLETVS